MVSAFVALLVSGASIGALHSLAPDHWIPFAAVARAQRWSRGRTARVTVACGLGHVTVSVALGVAALVLGTAVLEAMGRRLEAAASLLLIGFGVAYGAWGLRHIFEERLPGHSHESRRDPARVTAWTLFLLFCADPCVAVIPIVFAAAPLGVLRAVQIVVAYEVATIATMAALVLAAHAGAAGLRARWIDRWGDGAAGGVIAATGLLLLFAG